MSLLAPEIAQAALGRALQRGGDWAELYAEERTGFAVSLDDRRVERPQSGREVGASIRVVKGEATYFGHVDGLAEPDLLALADSVSQAMREEAREAQLPSALHPRRAYDVAQPPEEVEAARKIELLRVCDETARAAGGEVAQVSANYAEGRRVVAIFNSGGFAAGDDRTRVRLGVQVVARRDDRVETGHETRGGHAGFELVSERPEELAESAARKAITALDAVDAPAGRMPVVVGNGFGGVLLHEAIGHGLEADAVQKKASVYAGRVGDKLAEEFVTAYDDGRMPGAWGSDAIDDEGTPTQKTTIIEGGRLTSYLYDSLRAHKGKALSTGNGRRESFRHLPLPRMTNTYFAPGRRHAGGPDRRHRARPVRGLVRRRPGRARDGRLRLRRLRGLSDRGRQGDRAGARRDADRQRAGRARRDRRDRRRPRHRDRLLRQGRPARAGGSRPAARADQGAHGRGHRVTLEQAAAAALEAAECGRRDRRRGVGGGEPGARGPRVRGGGRVAHRRRRPRSRPARVRGRPLGLRVRDRPVGGRPARARGERARRRGSRRHRRVHGGLPDEFGATPVDGLHSAAMADWSTERKIELAIAVDRAARARKGVTQVEQTVYADSRGRVAIANSRGFAVGLRGDARPGRTRRRSPARAPT